MSINQNMVLGFEPTTSLHESPPITTRPRSLLFTLVQSLFLLSAMIDPDCKNVFSDLTIFVFNLT